MKQYTIDPVTRLEGHGKVEIFCNDDGDVENVYFQVPELRGFEKFVEGRPIEEVSQIVTKICGVCPGCHHMAAGKAADMVFGVEPTQTAKMITLTASDKKKTKTNVIIAPTVRPMKLRIVRGKT